MPKTTYQKVTKCFVDSVELPSSGRKFYNDSELRGFRLRVNATGVKAYVVERRVNGIQRRFVIGKRGELTPELARREAQRLLGEMVFDVKLNCVPYCRQMKIEPLTRSLPQARSCYWLKARSANSVNI